MQAALDEAQKYKTTVHPNPAVGATIVCANNNVHTAAHSEFGKGHAEVLVIKKCLDAGDSTIGAKLFVTLEPCAHQGKTPPCTLAVIEAGISYASIACKDPHPKVDGKGLNALKEAGIKVECGLLEKECFELNKEWMIAHQQNFPYTKIKLATSVDGKFFAANGQSKWITSDNARLHAQHLRQWCDCLITSAKTVTDDNPSFTARNKEDKLLDKQPHVFVLSRDTELSLDNTLLQQHPGGAEVLNSSDLSQTYSKLLTDGYVNSLVECGPTLSHAFINANMYNEIHLYMSAKLLGGDNNSFKAFADGELPGQQHKIHSLTQVDDQNFCLVLTPINEN